jgi:hypothetical protein
MIDYIVISVLSFVIGWLVSGIKSVDFMEKKFRAWMRMCDYDDESIERSIEEIKGIQL